MSALADLSVVDLSEGLAGALAAMILGDNGADVVRLVPPEEGDGDPIDRRPAARQWRRSSRVVVADDVDNARSLVAGADVAVISAEGWVFRWLGRSVEDLRTAHPALVVAVLEGDVDDGIVHAASGRMADWGRMFGLDRPAYLAPPLASYATANGMLQGVAAALHVRARTGSGQVARTDLVRGQMAFDLFGPGPRPPGPTRPTSRAPAPHPYLPYIPARAKDGRWIQWANWAPHLFWQQAELLGLGHLRADPRFAALPGPVDHDAGHEWWDLVLDATATKAADEWMAILRQTGTAGGDVFTHAVDGMDHPQVRHNGHVVTAADGSEQLGPIAIRHDSVPNLRAKHAQTGRDSHAGWGTGAGPLGDIVVIEAATMIAAPTGPCMLADLGARVVKVEPIGGEPGRSLPFLKMLQGKESICLDLKTPEGGEVFRRLVKRADILIHNYRPGVPEKLGIDYATLAAVNPALIYVYVGAYGDDGPCVRMPAYHPIPGAVCGAAALQAGTGVLDGPLDLPRDELRRRSLRLSRANETHPDAATGLLAATAALIGLVERDRDPSGAGQAMTVTMLAANAYVMSEDWISYEGRPPGRVVDADLLGTGPDHTLCETAEGWEFVSGTNRVRVDGDGFAALLKADIDGGNPRLSQEVETPGVGRHWRAAPIVELEAMAPVGGACIAGQHTVAVLEELGYSQLDIKSLLERDIAGAPSLI